MGATVFEIAGGPADPSWYKVWVPKGLVKEGLMTIVNERVCTKRYMQHIIKKKKMVCFIAIKLGAYD